MMRAEYNRGQLFTVEVISEVVLVTARSVEAEP
jgi:hypothetical protein